jgi:hypothetical protein
MRSLKSGTASVRESTPKKRSTSLPRIESSIPALSFSGRPSSTGLWPLALQAENKKPKFLYTLAPFGALRLNQTHEFLETHPELQGSVRRHLEEGRLYQLGLYEYTLARLDITEGLQGDAQTQALAQIQKARVQALLGRGSISAEQVPPSTDSGSSLCRCIPPTRTQQHQSRSHSHDRFKLFQTKYYRTKKNVSTSSKPSK